MDKARRGQPARPSKALLIAPSIFLSAPPFPSPYLTFYLKHKFARTGPFRLCIAIVQLGIQRIQKGRIRAFNVEI